MEPRLIRFERYALWKYVGPVEKLAGSYAGMEQAMAAAGLVKAHPFIEKYGHWTEDASKFEIELICPA